MIILCCITAVSFVLGFTVRTSSSDFEHVSEMLGSSAEELYADIMAFSVIGGAAQQYDIYETQELHWDGRYNPDSSDGKPPIPPYQIYFTNGLDPTDPDFEYWVIYDGLMKEPTSIEFQTVWKAIHSFSHEGISRDSLEIIVALRYLVVAFTQIFSYIKVFFFLITDTLGLILDLFNAFFYLVGF